MEPLLDYEPKQPNRQNVGTKVAIGIGGSIGVWFLVDELLSIFNIWFLIGCLALIIGVVFFRGESSKRSQQFWIVLILSACVVGWILLVFIFSFFNIWFFLLLVAGLGAVVFVKDRRHRQRQNWLDAGRCGNCGYDLHGTPDSCPECGRNSILDEPTWRKLRREWGNIKPADEIETEIAEPQPAPLPVISIPTILKTPDFHEGPIPLEGDEGG